MNSHRIPSILFRILLGLLVVVPRIDARASKGTVLLLGKLREPDARVHAEHVGSFIEKAGYTAELTDAEELLARADVDLTRYAGVVTAYVGPDMTGADRYPGWLVEQLAAGRPVVIIGSFGAYQNRATGAGGPDGPGLVPLDAPSLNRFFVPFGLEFSFAFTGDPSVLRITRKEKAFAEFEEPLDPGDLTYYQLLRSTNPDNIVHLGVERLDRADSESAFVVETPYGGMVLEPYAFRWSAEENRLIHRVDLTRFFERTLGKTPPPVTRYEPPPPTVPDEPVASTAPAVSTPPSRGTVALLYKSRDPNAQAYADQIGGFVRDAGYDYDVLDIEELLRSGRTLKSYRGVVTAYLSSQMIGASEYPRWLIKQMEEGLPICVIGSYGAYQGLLPGKDGRLIQWNEGTTEVNTFFYPFGLEFAFGFTGDPAMLRITRKDPGFVEFETPLTPADLKYYQFFRSVHPRNEIHLGVERKDIVDSGSAFVVHTPFGGMILESYAYFFSMELKKLVQRVDMARFIRRALDRKVPPVPRYDLETHARLVDRNPLPERPPPDEPAPLRGEISRHVLVLYKDADTKEFDDVAMYRRAEIVLNHLGIIAHYWPVDTRGPPPEEMMARYRGIITWFTTRGMKGARAYGEWLLGQVRAGRRLVIFQEYGANHDVQTQEKPGLERAIFRELGLEYGPLPPVRIEREPRIRLSDDLVGFEAPADPLLLGFDLRTRSIAPDNTVHLSMDGRHAGPIDLVVTGPRGGVALGDSAFYVPPEAVAKRLLSRQARTTTIRYEAVSEPYPGRWVIDPFDFFTRSLGLAGLPAPDVTTLNGARILYNHIDGDGLGSVSLIDKAHSAGWMTKKFILDRYPEIPQTVSVISLQVEKGGNEFYNPQVELAREIFRLPWVEVASHSATHPFDWTLESPYLANPGEYPFKIGYEPFDFVNEVWGSRLFIEANLAPPGKPMKMILWSGGTNPPENVMEITWRSGLENLNSGDPILDWDHPSVANLCPIGLKLGPYRKIHISAQNDFLYSDSMMGDWGGQRKVLEHFRRTGEPRRLMALNVYYHFYSGIKQEALDALILVFDALREMTHRGETAPVFASTYTKIAQDFYRTQILPERPGVWAVRNEGELRTIRFPGRVHVDVHASRGVLGQRHHLGQTYVHLDGSRVRRVVLADSEPRDLYLERASLQVDRARRDHGVLELDCRGLGHAIVTVAGARSGTRHRVAIQDDRHRTVHEETLTADATGRILLEHQLPSIPGSWTILVEEATPRP